MVSDLCKKTGKNFSQYSTYIENFVSDLEKPYPYRCVMSDLYQEVIAKIVKECFPVRGILSLTTKFDSPLMWSHYADRHKGVCIEYKVLNTTGYNFKKIVYRRKVSIGISDIKEWVENNTVISRKRIENKFYFSKIIDWKYEDERRLTSEKFGQQNTPFEISGIIFGLRCQPEVIIAVKKLIQSKNLHINFSRMRIYENSSRLEVMSLEE